MAEDKEQGAKQQETMQGNLRDKPQHASSFADNQYAGDTEPVPEEKGSAGGANVSRQGGGSDSSRQGGNTGHTPDASG